MGRHISGMMLTWLDKNTVECGTGQEDIRRGAHLAGYRTGIVCIVEYRCDRCTPTRV